MRRLVVAGSVLAVGSLTLTMAFMPPTDARSKPKPDKVTICHATGSEKNPYVELTVDAEGLNGHGDHEDDIIPAPPGGCPEPTPSPTPSPTTPGPTPTPTPSPTTPEPTPTPTPSTTTPEPTPSPTTPEPTPSPTTPEPSPSQSSQLPSHSTAPTAPTAPTEQPAPPITPTPTPEPCVGTTAGRTATGFVKFKFAIRPQAQADIDTFIQSIAPGSCVRVYGFAGFNAKQWALDISQKRARQVADYLEAQGFSTVVDGLAKTSAADFFGSPLAHNRMVVLVSQVK